MADHALTDRWRQGLFRVLEHHEAGMPLREAAVAGKLGDWTGHLTAAVVAACATVGWRAAAKGHLGEVLPEARNEYLGLDVVAFPAGDSPWPLPVAVFELENSRTDDRVGYSLWKVLCVRAALRVVFAYRRDVAEGAELVGRLASSLIAPMSITDRMALAGETTLIVGNRGGAETFPYGFFRAWTLDTNTGRFDRA
jgi:hypothetical protein